MNAGTTQLVVGAAALLLLAGVVLALVKIRSLPVRVAIVVSLASVVAMAILQRSAATAGAGGAGGAVAFELGPVRIPLTGAQVLVDEDMTVHGGGWQVRGLTLPGTRPIQVIAEGKAHAEKGFDVFVLSESEFNDHFSKKKPFHATSSFEGTKVKSFTHTDPLPEGTWYVLVRNSESADPIVVHLRLVGDPG
jgi:hypothetical protein